MKKVLSFIFIFVVSLLTVGCDGVTSTTNEPTDNVTTGSVTTQTPTTNAPTTLPPTTNVPTTDIPTTSGPEIVSVTLEVIDEYYELDEAFDETSITLTATYDNSDEVIIDNSEITLRGFNTSTPGFNLAYIRYQGFTIEYNYIVLEEYAFPIEMEYYEDAINLEGDILRLTLSEIINENFIPLLYGDARDILQESDVDPNNPDNIILVYTEDSIDKTWNCSGTDCTWNREHVWPQSRLGVRVGYGEDDFPSKATDMHNLKPAEPDENAYRSNHYFDSLVSNDTYEPNDNVKGDIARIILYMATMYPDLTLNDDPTTNSSFKTMGTLSVLLEWHELDPVDDFERNRNDVIFSYQGNRNPFIDYPEFVELIWGNNEE
jgi:endonuclease I